MVTDIRTIIHWRRMAAIVIVALALIIVAAAIMHPSMMHLAIQSRHPLQIAGGGIISRHPLQIASGDIISRRP